jgi:hypothetical protein
VGRAVRLLEARRVPLVAALVAALLTAPSLFAGLATEDFVQRGNVFTGPYRIPTYMNLFGHDHAWSAAEVAKRNLAYELIGWFPWLTDEHFHASFWRPIASFTHLVDYRYWPSMPIVMHAESILWYAALAFAVATLYRRFVAPAWVAGLAAMLYAVDDAHGHPVGWLINRNGIMATFFSVLALHSYDRFRRDGYRLGAVLTPVWFAMGLCSAEFALCAVGYFVSYAVFVDRAPWSRRLAASTSWGVALAAWFVAYRSLGHTTRASGLYIDPLGEPVAYAFEMAERATVLVMGVFGAPPSDLWTQSGPYAQGLVVFWAAAFGSFAFWVMWPTLRRDRISSFWGAGLVLSLLPACATFPEDRLLFFAGLGAMPLIARLAASCFGPEANASFETTSSRGKPAVALAGAWLVLHGVVAPLLLPYRSLTMFRYERSLREAGQSLFASAPPEPGTAVVVVNSENFYFAGMIAMTRAARAEATTPRMLTLAGTLEDVTLTRVDPRRLEVRPKLGFLSRVFNQLFTRQRLTRGDQLDLHGVTVTVSEVDQWGRPTAAVFEFALPLEDAHYRWVSWRNGRYEPFSVPPPGSSIVVRG